MSLDTIQLPGIIIEDLFKNSLIHQDSAIGKDSYDYLGQNLKNIAIIVDSPQTVFLPEQQLGFLIKMLEACRMTIADTAIINQAHAKVEILELKHRLNPRHVLLFGVEPTGIKLPFNIPPFKIQSYDNCIYLYAPGLDRLNLDTEDGKLLKSKLWVCLRTMFGI
jgi:hypothetical protein